MNKTQNKTKEDFQSYTSKKHPLVKTKKTSYNNKIMYILTNSTRDKY